MRFRSLALCALLAGAGAAGGLAVASPAWASDHATAACRIYADKPEPHGRNVKGEGRRGGCSDTVTYFWVRIYKVIDNWPDSEVAVNGRQYMQNDKLSVVGSCDGRDSYYTHTSTATGLSGDEVESSRALLC
jgi:hypothetical protein